MNSSRTQGLIRPARIGRALRNAAAIAAAFVAGAGMAGAEMADAGMEDAQTVITLKARVSLAESRGMDAGNQRVVLGDIASITGEGAEGLKDVEIASAASGLRRVREGVGVVDVNQVRGALTKARVNLGRVTIDAGQVMLQGPGAPSGCEVVYAVKATRAAEASEVKPRGPTYEVVNLGDGGEWTMRKAIAQRLASHYEVDGENLRLAFDERDEEHLKKNVGNRRLEIEPGGHAGSNRLALRVTMYEADRIVLGATLDVQAQVRRWVVTAGGRIARGEVVSESNSKREQRWVSPSEDAGPIDLSGRQIAVRSIEAGQAISADDVQAPIACKRGDIVWVHCLSGTVTVKAKARALGTARQGEMASLRLENADRKDQGTFQARMSGPGIAVMVVGNQGAE